MSSNWKNEDDIKAELRAIRRCATYLGGLSGRSQPDAVGSLLIVQRPRRNSLGDILWIGGVLPRQEYPTAGRACRKYYDCVGSNNLHSVCNLYMAQWAAIGRAGGESSTWANWVVLSIAFIPYEHSDSQVCDPWLWWFKQPCSDRRVFWFHLTCVSFPTVTPPKVKTLARLRLPGGIQQP